MLNIERPIAHQSSITFFFLYTLCSCIFCPPSCAHARKRMSKVLIILNFVPFAERDGSFHHYSFLQYQLTGGERKIKVKPHGNATKSSRPFKPSALSTKLRLKELVQTSTPKVAVNLLFEENRKRLFFGRYCLR